MKRLLSLSASLMILLTLLSTSMLSCGKRTRSAPDQVNEREDAMTKDELIVYLTQKNSRLEATHDAIYRLFGWISISLFIIAGTLLLLNLRENRRKDSKIYNSEQYIRHSIQAQEEERKRISLELHDSVAQDLRYVSLLAAVPLGLWRTCTLVLGASLSASSCLEEKWLFFRKKVAAS